MNDAQLLLGTTVGGAFVAGLILALPGSLTRPLAQHLGTSEGRAATLGAVLQLLLVPMMLVSGLLIDKWGPQVVLVLGTLLTACGIASLEFTRSYRHALLALLAVAVAGAGVSTASISLMPRAFFPDRTAASTNLGYVAFTLGVLLAPRLSGLLKSRLGFRRSLQMLALLCLLPAVPAVLTPAAAFAVGRPPADPGNVLADPRLWLAALIALLYQPLEGSLSAWTATYLKELGYPERTAPVLWWAFWAVFLATRLLAASFVQAGFAPWLILLLALLAAVTLGNLVGAYRPTSGGLGLLLVGMCFGPLFPTLVGVVLQMFPHQPGLPVGVVLASAAAGSLLLPPFIDVYARRTSARLAMRIPMVVALALMAPALVLALIIHP
jgi:fucose permease